MPATDDDRIERLYGSATRAELHDRLTAAGVADHRRAAAALLGRGGTVGISRLTVGEARQAIWALERRRYGAGGPPPSTT